MDKSHRSISHDGVTRFSTTSTTDLSGVRGKSNRHKGSKNRDAISESSFLSKYSHETANGKIEKRWNVFRSIPRNSDLFEPRCTLLASQFLKIIIYVLLHVTLTASGVVSKLIVLLMAANLRSNGFYTPCKPYGPQKVLQPESDAKRLPVNYTTWFYWSLWLAYCVPEILTFCRCIRIICFKFVPNPIGRVLTFSIVVETLQTVGVCILVFTVLPELDTVRAVMLLCGLATAPALLSALTRFQSKGSKQQRIMCFLDGVAFLMQVSSFIVWPIIDKSMNLKSKIMLPLGLLLTSLGWWENYVSRNSGLRPLSWLGSMKERIQRSRYKICILTSVLKCTISFFCMLVIGAYDHSLQSLFDLHNPFEIYLNVSSADYEQSQTEKSQYANYVFLMCVCLILSSYVAYECAKFACKVKMDWFSFALPVALLTPLCTIMLLGFCEMKKTQECYFASWIPDKLFWNCQYNKGDANSLNGLFVKHSAWVWSFWLMSYLWLISHIFTQKIGRLNRTDTIFVTPLYHGLLIDHSLALNRRRINIVRIKTEELEEDIGNKDESIGTLSTDQSFAFSMTSLSLANSRADTIPKIYICATMWHETLTEMTQMLKSILRMDEDQCARKNAQKYLKIVDPDYYELESHIFFDDAWELNEATGMRVPNAYVQQLVSVIDAAASSVHKVEMVLKRPVKIDVPYGGRLVWTLPGDSRLFVHLKDKQKIRTKKRWSQVMYMYYLLGHRIMEMVSDIQRKQLLADNTFLLAIDGDSKFDPSSVQKLVDLMKKRNRLGSACGRIHPIGAGFIVWYQKFEYAIAHWFQKATEHVFGCVLCAPGCFSLFRGSALMDDNVMQKYTKLPTEPRHFVQYDQGEDRWLSTLLLKQGYRIEYAAAADAETYAPESFDEFFNQRRRWTPSSIANTLDLLGDYKRTVQNNDSISRLYVFYQMLVIGFSMLGPGIIFTMMIFAQIAAFRKPKHETETFHANTVLGVNLVPIVIYCFLCFLGSSKVQLLYAKLLSVVYAFVMMAVLVGTGIQVTTEGVGSPISVFVFSMTGIFCVAAFFHPKEFVNIFNGAIFFLMIPCTYVLMSLYSLINLNVVNWGTREAAQKAIGGQLSETVLHKWMRQISSTSKRASVIDLETAHHRHPLNRPNSKLFCGCSDLCQCFVCADRPQNENVETFVYLGERLERLNRRINEVGDRTNIVGSHENNADFKPEILVTTPTPGRSTVDQSQQSRVQKPVVDSPSNVAQNKLNNVAFDKRSLGNCSSDDADAELSDSPFGSVETLGSGISNNGRVRPKAQSSPSCAPQWMQLDYLRDAPYDILDEMEYQFWVDLIDEHLKPLHKTPAEEATIAKSLISLRNNVAFGLLLVNSLLILVIYLLQSNKELLSFKWNPTSNYTIIKFDDAKGTYIEVQEPLKVGPISFTVILFLSFILLVQTLGMLMHRWQTLQHVLASTVLSCFSRRSSTEKEGRELVEENAVEIAKRLQKLGDDEHGDNGSNAGGNKKNKRKKIVFKLERARKRKQRVKGLHAAFLKRFFAFNPDKQRGSLQGIPLDKHSGLFQSGSAQKAAAAELKKRRDSMLQQPDTGDELNAKPPSSERKRPLFNPYVHSVDLMPEVKPTKLTFDSAAPSAEDSDRSSLDERTIPAHRNSNSNVNGNGLTKTVSFVDDLNRVLLEKRRKL